MLKKIIVRNVGVLRAFATPESPKLEKLTAFYARNGRGKTTLTAVLRAARDGEAATVLGRRSLGNGAAPPEVTLVVEGGGNIRFNNQAWSPKSSPIEVFDSTFIADNIYAGELIDLVHDRGLFSIIIGPDGVKLAKKLEFFNAAARRTAGKLKEAESSLRDDIPTDMNMDEFFALAPNPAYDRRIEDADKALKAVQQAERVAALKPLEELVLPAMPAEVEAVLASTVPDIDVSARQRLVEHFMKFQLGRKGEEWVTYGLEHIHDDACAFCGRADVDEHGLVTLYGQIFGETYKAHLKKITDTGSLVDTALGDDARAASARSVAANAEGARQWSEFVSIEGVQLPDSRARLGISKAS